MDTGNYRRRVQGKGTIKDIKGSLRHSRTTTTTDVYMQELPEGDQPGAQKEAAKGESAKTF
jgi:hypothetical protein